MSLVVLKVMEPNSNLTSHVVAGSNPAWRDGMKISPDRR